MQDLIANGFIPGKTRILDVAAGYGQYLCYSSRFGYDCYGLEPEMENMLWLIIDRFDRRFHPSTEKWTWMYMVVARKP